MNQDQVNDKSFVETIIQEIGSYQSRTGCDIMEAIVWFCAQADMDPADLVKRLPNQERARIREELIAGRYVRQAVATPTSKLPIGD